MIEIQSEVSATEDLSLLTIQSNLPTSFIVGFVITKTAMDFHWTAIFEKIEKWKIALF